MVWIKFLIIISVLLGTITFLISMSDHRYKGAKKYGNLIYSLSGIVILSEKQLLYPKDYHFYFIMLYVLIIFYFFDWLFTHFGETKRINLLMTEKLGDALPVTWDALFKVRVGVKVQYPFATSEKVFQSEVKMVFESTLTGDEIYYFSDFTKDFHVLDGELTIVFKDGTIEKLVSNSKSRIRAYEVHKLISDKCKLLVTCIK